jgi:chaperone modulatory protein CbpM
MIGHMIGERELIDMIEHVEAEALRRWVDLGWILPQGDGDSLRFDESDVARVRLICELHYELRIEEDSMSVVLSLMDQLYEARRSLRTVLSAVEAQPENVRAAISALVNAKR